MGSGERPGGGRRHDRSKGEQETCPADQADPDLFVRVIERRPDGIVVRGSKVHQTGAINSHEILVMPTQTMREEDKDYAVSFACPLMPRVSSTSTDGNPAIRESWKRPR